MIQWSPMRRPRARHGMSQLHDLLYETILTSINGRLYTETLPSDQMRLRSLAQKYFEHVHHIRCYNFIYRPTFLKALDDGDLFSVYGHALVHIICAHGARLFSPKLTPSEDTDHFRIGSLPPAPPRLLPSPAPTGHQRLNSFCSPISNP